MSEIEKLKAQVNRIYEGLAGIVSALNELEEAWEQGGKAVAAEVAVEKVAKEALAKATPMKNKPGLWLWSRDSPALKDALLKSKRRLTLTIEGKNYNVRLGDGREEKDAFISFWPKKA